MGPNSFWIRNVTFIHFHEIVIIGKYLQPFHSIGVYPAKFSDYYCSTLKQLCSRSAQVTKHIPQSFNMSIYWPISDLLLPFNFEKFRQLLAYHMGTHFVHN